MNTIQKEMEASHEVAKEPRTFSNYSSNTEEKEKKPRVVWTPETVITFGKYKDQLLKDVPVSYIRWLSGYVWDPETQSLICPVSESGGFHRKLAKDYLSTYQMCLGCGEPREADVLYHDKCVKKVRPYSSASSSSTQAGPGKVKTAPFFKNAAKKPY
jgi:hypothetical protein